MSNKRTIADGDRFILTQRGKDVLKSKERCSCVFEVRETNLHCVYCGTVFGLVRAMFGASTRDHKRD